jgi:hypothetical protein
MLQSSKETTMKTASMFLTGLLALAFVVTMDHVSPNRAEAGIRGTLTIVNATNDTAVIYVNGRLIRTVTARQVGQIHVGDRGDATTVVQAVFDNGVTRVYRISSDQPYYSINVGFPQ